MQSTTVDMDLLTRHREAVRARLLEAGVRRAGPEGISWAINRQIIVVAGWGRAVLLQVAHPAVAAGVHDHSAFAGSLRTTIQRVRSTVHAMLCITFEDVDRMIDVAAAINAIHDRVRGHGYSAHDPNLLCWVHATLLDSTLNSYEMLVGPLTAEQRDRYCAEASIMEPLLGIPHGLLPRTSAELATYMRDMLTGGDITVTDTSRALAKAVLTPRRWYIAWPAFRPLQLMTIGALPEVIRQAYGFTWRPRDERALARWTAVIRTSQRLLPRAAREWPIARSGSAAWTRA